MKHEEMEKDVEEKYFQKELKKKKEFFLTGKMTWYCYSCRKNQTIAQWYNGADEYIHECKTCKSENVRCLVRE